MRFLGHLLMMVGVALFIGFGLSWYALSDFTIFGSLRVGPWTNWRDAGSATPDPYTRAHVARAGALQLGSGEGLRFLATTDSDGQRLERNCRYRIDGTTPAAAFWTLMAIDLDYGIIARAGTPQALNSNRIARASDGSLQVYVSKLLSPRNWLQIDGDGPFALALTLYDVSSLGGSAAAPGALPAVIREACI